MMAQVGDERPVVEEMGNLEDHQTAMTLMESSSVNVFESLKAVLDFQVSIHNMSHLLS